MLNLVSNILAINCFQTLENQAINGRWQLTVDGDVDLCVKTCKSMQNCTAITYTTTYTQTCTLWSEISSIISISNVTTLKRSFNDSSCDSPKINSCAQCQYSAVKNTNGNQTAYKIVDSESDCRNSCDMTKSCLAYSVNQGAYQLGCLLYLEAIYESRSAASNFLKKGQCSCPSNVSSNIPPARSISQMEVLGLTLVAIFGIVALSGVIYVILYSYKPMKKSIPRWHSTNSPTTPIDNAYTEPYPIKEEEKRESVAELRSMNLLDVDTSAVGGSRLSLPAGYVKLSDFNGNPYS
eukprot:NODE_27_length_39007_cov_1.590650.p16 type:complete len:294 gc:universal NODE_27_length_39007_cov_1.590650:8725-7844(-)